MGATESIPEDTILIYTFRCRDTTSVSGYIRIYRDGNILHAVATLTVGKFCQETHIILKDRTTVLARDICSGGLAFRPFRLRLTITKHDNDAVEVICLKTEMQSVRFAD